MKSSKFAFSEDHVLYGKLRPYLAKIALPDFDGICSTDILPVRPKRQLDRRFLALFLRTPDMVALASARATGINLPRLSPSELADFELPLPPIEEQRRIAAILDQADALRAKRRAALAQLDEMALSFFLEMFVRDAQRAASWPQVAIGSLAQSMRTGPFGSQLLHSEFVDSGVAVLGIDNAVTNRFAWDQRRFITEAKYRQLSRFRVNPRDLIVTIMGTCGRAAIVPADIPLAITTKHLCSITLDQKRCLPEYLHAAFLMHPGVLRQLGVSARGAVMPGLNMGLIKETVLPLPPIELQREYAQRRDSLERMEETSLTSEEALNALFTSLQHRAFRGEL